MSPDRPGIGPWTVVAGLALLAIAATLRHAATVQDAPGGGLVQTLRFAGLLAIPVGLTIAAMLQRGVGWGVRAAFLVAAAYFMTHVPGAASLMG